MAVDMKRRNRLVSLSPAPPPSPIPTGKGSRSAADPLVSDYIDNAKQIPELFLPENVSRSMPAAIDYRLLVSEDVDTVNRLLRSASEFGVFQIFGHGISCEELKSILAENEWIFEQLTQSCGRYADREEFVWCHSTVEKAKDTMSEENFNICSQIMMNIARKLEEIAQELAPIIATGEAKQFQKEIQRSESTLVLFRYNQNQITDQLSSAPKESDQVSKKYTLRLHLLLEPGEFCAQSKRLHLPFRTGRDTIIVALENDSKERKAIEFNPSFEEPKFKPGLQQSGPIFSIELRWSSSYTSSALSNSTKKFSLVDQLLFLLILVLLYKTCSLLASTF